MYANRVGSAWEVFAPAKLNLYLEVLGSRADGFHNLESLLLPVRLYDHLQWIPSPSDAGCALDIRGLDGPRSQLPKDNRDNLVLRAAHLLARTAGVPPQGTFQLHKRIPIEAGLGGGSSDAAATLVLANQAWGIGYSIEKLAQLAAELGSDVPFFLARGPAVCRGRGEIVEPIPRLPRLHFVVVKPTESLATAAVFREWKQNFSFLDEKKPSGLSPALQALRKGDLWAAGRWMNNRLQQAASRLSPVVGQVCEFLSELGFAGSAMSGSGTACWGLARSARHARNIARRISNCFAGQVYCISSCSAA